MLGPTVEEEEVADRYFAAREWVALQAELVTSLEYQGHPMLAHRVIQGVLVHIHMWDYFNQHQLIKVYRHIRADTDRRWRNA